MNTSPPSLRLGVNIDHIATVRNARGGIHPCPIQGALLAKAAGADGITAHLREDRRHIRDEDIARLKAEVALPLNMEMAATEEMLAIALATQPNAACLVPEKREEVTTEGGLDVRGNMARLQEITQALRARSIRVSLFIAPDMAQIEAAAHLQADIIELHTGTYCEHSGEAAKAELTKLAEAARYAHSLGLEVHAGHGLRFDNVQPIAALPEVVELNIGHFLMGEAMFIGLPAAIQRMRELMDSARTHGAAA